MAVAALIFLAIQSILKDKIDLAISQLARSESFLALFCFNLKAFRFFAPILWHLMAFGLRPEWH